MKVALIQSDIVWGDVEANIAKAGKLASKAAEEGAELLLFTEMFTSGFTLVEGEEAQRIGVRSSQFLAELAERESVYCCGTFPFVEEDDPRPFNMLELHGPEGKCGAYAKRQLFTYAGENKVYRSGQWFFTESICGVNVSFLICYDLRFPSLFDRLAEKTDLFVVPANWPRARKSHWPILLSARAIDNQAYVAGINRIGQGGDLFYEGASQVVSPRGEVIADAGSEEGFVIVEILSEKVAEYRQEFPSLVDKLSQEANS